jgi:hypothetical protein
MTLKQQNDIRNGIILYLYVYVAESRSGFDATEAGD